MMIACVVDSVPPKIRPRRAFTCLSRYSHSQESSYLRVEPSECFVEYQYCLEGKEEFLTRMDPLQGSYGWTYSAFCDVQYFMVCDYARCYPSWYDCYIDGDIESSCYLVE